MRKKWKEVLNHLNVGVIKMMRFFPITLFLRGSKKKQKNQTRSRIKVFPKIHLYQVDSIDDALRIGEDVAKGNLVIANTKYLSSNPITFKRFIKQLTNAASKANSTVKLLTSNHLLVIPENVEYEMVKKISPSIPVPQKVESFSQEG